MNNYVNKFFPSALSNQNLALQINFPKQTSSFNLAKELLENTPYKKTGENYFTTLATNKFAQDCFNNTTKHQKGN